jgi:hypothetical protein
MRILLGLIDEQPDLTLDEVVAVMRRSEVPGKKRCARLLLLDLPALVALACPALGGADVLGVLREPLLLLEALDELVAAHGDGVASPLGHGGEGEGLQDSHDQSSCFTEDTDFMPSRRN